MSRQGGSLPFLYSFQCRKGRYEVVRDGFNLDLSFANEYEEVREEQER